MDKQSSIYDVSAPQAIVPLSPLNPLTQLVGFIPQSAGSAGNLTFNDCATLEEASAENQIISYPYAEAYGSVGINSLNIPLTAGLVVSEVPTDMVLTIIYAAYVVG